MALADLFKDIGTNLSQEIRDFKSILGRIRLTSDTSALGANFRKHGSSFGIYDFDAYVKKAREFFKEATEKRGPLYTIVEAGKDRVAIDYDGEIRGVFTVTGKPLAFFRFDYNQFGYRSKLDAMDEFKRGLNLPPAS